MKKYELIENKENILATLENDTLKRNGKLLNLIKILNLLSENFILSIDGSWGCGKTFFVKQLEYVLNSDMNLPLIDKNSSEILSEFRDRHVLFYYNAWENDDHGSPLGSLIFSILNDYPKYKDCVIDNKNIFTTIKPILKNIISKSTGNILSPEVFDRLTTFEELAEEVITVEEKKTAINKLFNNIIPNNKRLILVIDELDRCRPDFAVKMLETIKHFYFNPKITVIVVTNNKELSNTVKKFYGEGFDGYRYLN
ncbi:MAG: AAA family ATPase [Mollicutes bacterium]|nr:AAA family ATPase [Mollicutes bacterium]